MTYPPDFRYITESQIRSTMGQLAAQIYALESLMAESETPLARDQRKITEILEAMQTSARELTRGKDTHHPDLNRYAPLLERRVDRALFGARLNPPNYFFAGAVSGACEYCHAPRHRADGTGARQLTRWSGHPPRRDRGTRLRREDDS